jgi:hypothetical protein
MACKEVNSALVSCALMNSTRRGCVRLLCFVRSYCAKCHDNHTQPQQTCTQCTSTSRNVIARLYRRTTRAWCSLLAELGVDLDKRPLEVAQLILSDFHETYPDAWFIEIGFQIWKSGDKLRDFQTIVHERKQNNQFTE